VEVSDIYPDHFKYQCTLPCKIEGTIADFMSNDDNYRLFKMVMVQNSLRNWHTIAVLT